MNRSAAHTTPFGVAEKTVFHAGPGGLLPWQGALLAGVCGVFALVHPLPGVTALVLLWMVWSLLGGRIRAGLGMLLGFAIGLLLAWVHLPSVPDLPDFVGSGEKLTLTGTVDDVQPRPDKRLTVVLTGVEVENPKGTTDTLPGRVSWAWHDPMARVEPGQTVTLVASIDPMRSFGNPGAWDYGLAQRVQDIHTRIYSRGARGSLVLGNPPDAPAGKWRSRLVKRIHELSPGQGGAMMAALLAGDRFFLDPETLDMMRTAGLSHTLALSGLHLGFVVVLGYCFAWGLGVLLPGLLLKVPRPKLAVVVATPLVVGYLWLGGFAPSLLRSSLMFAFMAYFLMLGRGRVAIDGLFFALAVILVLDPLSALDIRLQLSALAVGGLAVFMPALLSQMRNLPGMQWRIFRWAVGILAVSVCATLCILPVTARTFGLFAPNLLLNLVWLPLLGVIVMPIGLAGLALSVVSLDLGEPFLTVGSWILGHMLAAVGGMREAGLLPVVQLLRPYWPQFLGAFVLLASLAASMRLQLERERSLWAAVVLGLALMIWPQVLVMAEDANGLKLDVVDVGTGQALVITAPGGKRTVIDGGGLRSRTFDSGRDVVAPYLTYGRPPRIENVILTHPHADHYKGLIHLLRFFDVQAFRYGGALPGGAYRKPFKEALGNLEPVRFFAGDRLVLGDGIQLDTIFPSSDFKPPTTNDASLVQRLVYKGSGLALLPGDVEKSALERLITEEGEIRSQVLVLPHHGSRTSYYPDLYGVVSPEAAIGSSGFRNRHIHPFSAVLEALKKINSTVYTTWKHGLVRVSWQDNGKQMDVSYAITTGR